MLQPKSTCPPVGSAAAVAPQHAVGPACAIASSCNCTIVAHIGKDRLLTTVP